MRRPLLILGSSLLVAAWVVWLRPSTLGGSASYIVVDGTSMDPTYQDGDLVLVRGQDQYREGDVIAFRAGGRFDDRTRIIHRIVGGDATEGFLTRGDNRDEIDPWRPTPDDIIGRAAMHIPKAGGVASLFARPQTMAALGGTAVVVGGGRRRRRRRATIPPDDEASAMNHAAPSDPAGPARRPPVRTVTTPEPRWALIGLVACALLAVPTLGMAWSALRAPDSLDRVEQFGSLDYGIELDYTASGQPSPVYPSGSVSATKNPVGVLSSPDPLYLRLLDRIDVRVGFDVASSGADRTDGTYAVDVRVETPDGWTTDLTSVEEAPLTGRTDESVTIDLRAVAGQVAQITSLTGVGGDTYSISVVPRLDVAAEGGGARVADQLSAPLRFVIAGEVITVEGTELAESEPLARTVSERASYAIGPFDLSTQAARAVLSGLSLVLVGGLVWFASVLFRGVGLGEPARIAARYRSQVVDVSAASAPPGPVVMVGSIEELARIAKVDQNVILHEDMGDGAHRYRVFLGTVTYEYETAPAHAGAAASSAGAVEGGTG